MKTGSLPVFHVFVGVTERIFNLVWIEPPAQVWLKLDLKDVVYV